jgi:hypothetical protein
MSLPGQTKITIITGDMSLSGHMVPWFKVVDFLPHFDHFSGEFMSQDLGKPRDYGLGPGVPFKDVYVRAADGSHFDPDEYIFGPRLRDFHLSP